MNINETIQNLDKGALVNLPASDHDIIKCNQELTKSNISPLPNDFIEFLKIANGIEFNGMQIFGTKKGEILKFTIQNRDYREDYDDISNLLFFGRIDDDLYTYNLRTQKYEARDICSLDIWDAYDTFYDFFSKEMMKWLV